MATNIDKLSSYLTQFKVNIDGIPVDTIEQVTVEEVNLTESLLVPGLQTNVVLTSTTNNTIVKNLDTYYGKTIEVLAERPIIDIMYNGKYKSKFQTQQTIYRLSKRDRTNYQVERFSLDACDPSLLVDASKFISKSWKGATPSTVVSDILTGSIGNVNLDIEESGPKRDYIAEMVKPFQGIVQQGEVALKKQNDPSYTHFMTYQDIDHIDKPTHNFRSLTAMATQDVAFSFSYGGKASTDLNYADPGDIMTYMFPCDFDLLSDILNGLDPVTGMPTSRVNILNTLTGKFGTFGTKGVGNFENLTPHSLTSNMATETIQNSSELGLQMSAQLRKARMALLDQDKIALRMVIPFLPHLNVGRTINASFYNTATGALIYGSGKYLISALTHSIKLGGLGTTTLDCVANTVAVGRQ